MQVSSTASSTICDMSLLLKQYPLLLRDLPEHTFEFHSFILASALDVASFDHSVANAAHTGAHYKSHASI